MPGEKASRFTGVNRRQFVRMTSLAGLGALAGNRFGAFGAETVNLPFANGQRSLVSFPQKRSLIVLTTRPPQLETPLSIFNDGLLTPNDAFFVRYHLSQIPTSIDPEQFSLEIKGPGKFPFENFSQRFKERL